MLLNFRLPARKVVSCLCFMYEDIEVPKTVQQGSAVARTKIRTWGPLTPLSKVHLLFLAMWKAGLTSFPSHLNPSGEKSVARQKSQVLRGQIA